MKVVGLCGGSGSGKGTACLFFLDAGIPSIDTDLVYREITGSDSECMRALVNAFGRDIQRSDGSLDRAALANIVFGDREKLDLLNSITHKFILGETRVRLRDFAALGYSAAIVDAPLLFESGFNRECDLILCVLAEIDIRIDRIIARDGISIEAAVKRIKAQISNEELIGKSDFVIYNNGDLDDLRDQVNQAADKILKN